MLISLNSWPFLSCGPNLSNDRQVSRYGLSLITAASTTTSLGMGLFFDELSRSLSASLAASWFFHASSTYTGNRPFASIFEMNEPFLSSAYVLRRCALMLSLFVLS